MSMALKRKLASMDAQPALALPAKALKMPTVRRTAESSQYFAAAGDIPPSSQAEADGLGDGAYDGDEQAEIAHQLGLIAGLTHRTPHERRVWTLLCQVPRGQVTTYALLAAAAGSSPRAVGNALRRNPLAPGVPCHRVVASDKTLGGFKGERPPSGEGTTLTEKRELLKGEGVRFDSKGKVLGSLFNGFAA